MGRVILFFMSLIMSQWAYASVRPVLCQGRAAVKGMDGKTIDQGQVKIRFALKDSVTARNIKMISRFKDTQAQSISVYESRAHRRAVASGSGRADLFDLGHNGACQVALAYQGGLSRRPGPQKSWGVLTMGCGAYLVQSKMKCLMK